MEALPSTGAGATMAALRELMMRMMAVLVYMLKFEEVMKI
jgi:hypothetical protein